MTIPLAGWIALCLSADPPGAGPLHAHDLAGLHTAVYMAFDRAGGRVAVAKTDGDWDAAKTQLLVLDADSGRVEAGVPMAGNGGTGRYSGIQPFGDDGRLVFADIRGRLRRSSTPGDEAAPFFKALEPAVQISQVPISVGPGEKTAFAIPLDSPDAVTRWEIRIGPGTTILRSVLGGPENGVRAVAFDPDHRRVALLTEVDDLKPGVNIDVWEMGPKPTKTTVHFAWRARTLSLSPDAVRVAVGRCDGVVSCYDIDAKSVQWTSPPLAPERWTVHFTAFHPSGRHVVAGNLDSRNPDLHILDAATGAPVARLRPDPKGTSAAAFSPDGKRLATFGGSGVLKIWDFDALLKPTGK